MTLHLYFARRFLTLFTIVFLAFFIFQFTVDFVEHIRRFGGSTMQAAQLAILITPSGLYQILPLIALISGLFGALGLARRREWVVTRAAGRSIAHALIGPVLAFFAMSMVILAVGNPFVAATQSRYAENLANAGKTARAQFSIGSDGLWLRQGGQDGITVLRAGRSGIDATQLFDISVVQYDPQNRPRMRLEASSARLLLGEWLLTGVTYWNLQSADNPQETIQKMPQYRLATTLTKEDITDSFGVPSSISIWALPKFIAQLQTAGFSARNHIAWLWSETSKPIFLVAMMLLGAAFGLHQARVQKNSLRLLSALLSGFAMYYMRDLATIFAQGGQLPAATAAWITAFASCFIAFGVILHLEEG